MPDPSAINHKISKISSEFLMGDRGIFKAADTFPRKH
jgi:hypothetical protein